MSTPAKKPAPTGDASETAAETSAPSAPKRRVGRPRNRVLSRRLILETGLRLIDERGAHGVGMRAIASELGVRPSALYNHIGGEAELIAGVRELISDRIAVDMFASEPWDEALAGWATHYRSTFAAHPPTIALLATLPLAENSVTSQMYETVIAALVRAGWSGERALALMVALESFILGSALDLAADDSMLDPGPRDDVPEFTAAYAERSTVLAERGVRPADAAFDLGLRAILNGFRAEYTALGLRPRAHA
ncbi:TetR/AcrR family transcriptional regulator [Leucobacter chromiireducens]|uniref:TetR/AcrR family transcriptional regulator n=1 Tax=Leucobacter chromiireducens TaxID=283877 RepID=UPI000F636DDE|nr:TetR family transcriptional regulator [Leucobacter chromiireducens]